MTEFSFWGVNYCFNCLWEGLFGFSEFCKTPLFPSEPLKWGRVHTLLFCLLFSYPHSTEKTPFHGTHALLHERGANLYETKCENDRPINSTTHLFVLSSTSTGKLQHLPRGTLIPTTSHALPAMKSAASLNTSSSSVYPLLSDWGLWEGGKYCCLLSHRQQVPD